MSKKAPKYADINAGYGKKSTKKTYWGKDQELRGHWEFVIPHPHGGGKTVISDRQPVSLIECQLEANNLLRERLKLDRERMQILREQHKGFLSLLEAVKDKLGTSNSELPTKECRTCKYIIRPIQSEPCRFCMSNSHPFTQWRAK